MRTIELFFTESDKQMLETYYVMSGGRNRIMTLPLALDFGDISDPMNEQKRKDAYTSLEMQPEQIREQVKKTMDEIGPEDKLRLWFDSCEPRRYCGFTHAVSLFRDNEIIPMDVDLYNTDAVTLMNLAKETRRALNEAEKASCINKWERLSGENAPLRTVAFSEDQKTVNDIVSVGMGCYDETIIDRIAGARGTVAELIEVCMQTDPRIPRDYAKLRIAQLLSDGILKYIEKKDGDFLHSEIMSA